jgi:predicted ArsR family transcriptional regulator
VQAGSIPDRILEVLREQQSMQLPEIVEWTKARKHDVKAALDELITAEHVQRVGKVARHPLRAAGIGRVAASTQRSKGAL